MIKYLKTFGFVAILLGIYFFAQFMISILFGFGYGFKIGYESARTGMVVDATKIAEQVSIYISKNMPLILLLAIVIVFVIYFVIFKIKKISFGEYCKTEKISLKIGLVIVIMGISANYLATYILTLLSEIKLLEGLFSSYEKLSQQLVSGNLVMTFLVIGIIAPIFEEILFRGLIYGALRKVFRVSAAMLIQVVLFGLYHLNAIQGIYAIVVALLIGYVYLKYKSIVAAMLLHISLNITAIATSQSNSQKALEILNSIPLIFSFLIFTAMMVILVMDGRKEQDKDIQMNIT